MTNEPTQQPEQVIEIFFDHNGLDWSAMRDAEVWVKERGWSVGPSCMTGNRGIVAAPEVLVAKWRNLTLEERGECVGVLVGRGSDKPRTIKIKESALPLPSVMFEIVRRYVPGVQR